MNIEQAEKSTAATEIERNLLESNNAVSGWWNMPVHVPREIIAENHRKAYAHGYRAGFHGRFLRYMAPTVKNSLVRGFLTGQEDRYSIEQAEELEAESQWRAEQEADAAEAMACPF